MELEKPLLIVATLLCALSTGLVFTFAVVVMPGIRRLEDREFIRAFQVVDEVIQRGQPLFILVWVGSIVAVVAALAVLTSRLTGFERLLLVLGGGVYLVGMQLPTFLVNVPLNNAVQKVDVAAADDVGARAAREAFERRWNRWNGIRTLLGSVSVVLLLALLAVL